MKNIISFIFLLFSAANVFAQKETFDISTYAVPQGWDKKPSEKAIQFSKEDATKGTYCLITLYMSVPGTANVKENFDLAWSTLVKESVTVSSDPEMQPATSKDGWEAQSGYAPFESDGNKGIVVLVTSSGFQKMVNIIILTNTQEYEKDITDFLESVSFQKPVVTQTQDAIQRQQPETANDTGITARSTDNEQQNSSNTNHQLSMATGKSGFQFDTSNFDDGWNSIAKEDWVEVTKANIKVLIHYPNKQADAYNSVLLDGLKNAWDILVATKYNSASNLEFKPITGWQSIEFAEADMVEKTIGKTVHVVLFKMNYSNGSGKYLEFITPNKKSFEQEFGPYHQTSSGWEKIENMANYNKFAVAASDLNGKWTNDFSGAIQYVNAYTGFDAGMDTHASNESFEIGPGNAYTWDLGVASGQVGNIKFQSRKSSGKFSMIGNWQVNFSDIEGRPRTYNAYFSCIKGLRILWLDDRAFAKKE
jgi:hypothetical protein